MMSLLLAASLAGQIPVSGMITACHEAMDSRAGQRYLALDVPIGPEMTHELDSRRAVYQAELLRVSHSRGLDPVQTNEVCDGIILGYLEGVRAQLGRTRVVVDTH